MQNRVRLEIVDGPLKGKKFEFAEHDTLTFLVRAVCLAHRIKDKQRLAFKRGRR
jgi:hypothetical protein